MFSSNVMLLLMVIRVNLSLWFVIFDNIYVGRGEVGVFPADVTHTHDTLLIGQQLVLHRAYIGSFIRSVALRKRELG